MLILKSVQKKQKIPHVEDVWTFPGGKIRKTPET